MPTTRRTSVRVDLDRSAVARYLQLASLFRRRIESGDWPVGQQIPTLDALTEECGVATATVRKSIAILIEEGLLAPHRAKGTYVLRSPVRSIWREIETNGLGVIRAREGAKIQFVSSSVTTTPPFPPGVDGRLCDSYDVVRRVYWRDDQPFLWLEFYIASHVAAQIPRASLRSKTGDEIVKSLPDVRIKSMRQTLTIGAADIEAAHHLHIPLNAPVARIDRLRIDTDDRFIFMSTGIYRGDVVRLDFRQDFPA